MASVATTNITNVTRQTTGGKGTALSLGGLPVEHFRIAAGQASGDTAVLVPTTFNNIRGAFGGPFTHSATAATGATNVTITLVGGTATIPAVDIFILGPVPTTN